MSFKFTSFEAQRSDVCRPVPDTPNTNPFAERFAQSSDRRLQEVLQHPSHYSHEAVEAAQAEFDKRGLTTEVVENVSGDHPLTKALRVESPLFSSTLVPWSHSRFSDQWWAGVARILVIIHLVILGTRVSEWMLTETYWQSLDAFRIKWTLAPVLLAVVGGLLFLVGKRLGWMLLAVGATIQFLIDYQNGLWQPWYFDEGFDEYNQAPYNRELNFLKYSGLSLVLVVLLWVDPLRRSFQISRKELLVCIGFVVLFVVFVMIGPNFQAYTDAILSQTR